MSSEDLLLKYKSKDVYIDTLIDAGRYNNEMSDFYFDFCGKKLLTRAIHPKREFCFVSGLEAFEGDKYCYLVEIRDIKDAKFVENGTPIWVFVQKKI